MKRATGLLTAAIRDFNRLDRTTQQRIVLALAEFLHKDRLLTRAAQ